MAEKKKSTKQAPVKPANAEERKKALDGAIAYIEKQFGKGSIMTLGKAPDYNVDVISTGSMTLDMALGIGGLPRGRIVEIYGPESSGKTTVALHALAQAQKKGGEVAFIDVEHALDPVYAKALGVDIDNLLVSQPDSGEQALEIAEALVRSGAIDCIVVDSVAAMVTKAEIDGEMGDSHVGLLARLMSQAMRKLTGVISKSNCVAIFINQVREKIGISYGNPETTPGGRALKFYSSVRIEVRKGETIKVGSEPIGARTKCKVVKNKVAPPFKECEFDMIFGKGIDRIGEVCDLAEELGIIKKSGAWFSYNDQKIGQGRENAKEYLRTNPEDMQAIEEKIKENAHNIVMVSKKSKKAAAKDAAAAGASAVQEDEDSISYDEPESKKSSSKAVKAADIEVDADDDYEEFTPLED
ncbi:MAG: recombinase RecA [Oscillospiraceae bacterium]|nr:recombinase RecA [Oscillospiraceae bacterium]